MKDINLRQDAPSQVSQDRDWETIFDEYLFR